MINNKRTQCVLQNHYNADVPELQLINLRSVLFKPTVDPLDLHLRPLEGLNIQRERYQRQMSLTFCEPRLLKLA